MIIIKTPEEIQKMGEGGRILARILKKVARAVKPGISTMELNNLAEELMAQNKALPSFKNYRGFQYALCASVNYEVVHIAPKEYKILKKGDLIGLDLGLKYKGYYTDMALTVPVGEVSKRVQKLIKATKKALDIGISQVKPSNQIGDISAAIQKYVEGQDLAVVRTLVGHGVGKEVHEEPRIPNFGEPHTGPKLEVGMTLAIEPMVNIGGHAVKTLDDGWTIETIDKSLSAHFEHTVAVTKKGCEILTK